MADRPTFWASCLEFIVRAPVTRVLVLVTIRVPYSIGSGRATCLGYFSDYFSGKCPSYLCTDAGELFAELSPDLWACACQRPTPWGLLGLIPVRYPNIPRVAFDGHRRTPSTSGARNAGDGLSGRLGAYLGIDRVFIASKPMACALLGYLWHIYCTSDTSDTRNTDGSTFYPWGSAGLVAQAREHGRFVPIYRRGGSVLGHILSRVRIACEVLSSCVWDVSPESAGLGRRAYVCRSCARVAQYMP